MHFRCFTDYHFTVHVTIKGFVVAGIEFGTKTSLKTDISHTLMRKAPKKPFKFLINNDILLK